MAVQIQAVKRRGFLRQIAEQAKRASSTLGETLLAAQSGHFVQTFQRGRLVVSQSGSGQAGSYQVELPGAEWTQSNVFGLIEELLELLEYCVANGATDDGDPATTAALMQTMFADQSMQSSKEQFGDFTLVGLPNIYGTR